MTLSALHRVRASTGETRRQIEALLETGEHATSELRLKMNVSRQRVRLLLTQIQADGRLIVHSRKGERSRQTYSIARQGSGREATAERSPILSSSRAMIVSAFSPGAVYRVKELADWLGTGRGHLTEIFKDFSQQGLILRLVIGPDSYVTIAEKGLGHKQYDRRVEKAPRVELQRVFGALKSLILLRLDELGQARTTDVTKTASAQGLRTAYAGQVMQRLQLQGLAVRIPGADGTMPFYELTTSGKMFVRMMRSQTDASIAHAHALTSLNESFGSVPKRAPPNNAKLVETHKAILRYLDATGPQTNARLRTALFPVPFKKAQTLRLALHLLKTRGYLTFIETGKRKHALWAVTNLTLSFLRKAKRAEQPHKTP